MKPLAFRIAIPFPVHGDPIAPECRPYISPMDQISFADSNHRLWYATWWDGKCVGLGLRCSRITYWNTLVKPSLDHKHPTVDPNKLGRGTTRYAVSIPPTLSAGTSRFWPLVQTC
jgi:hypothetical protein